MCFKFEAIFARLKSAYPAYFAAAPSNENSGYISQYTDSADIKPLSHHKHGPSASDSLYQTLQLVEYIPEAFHPAHFQNASSNENAARLPQYTHSTGVEDSYEASNDHQASEFDSLYQALQRVEHLPLLT